MKFPAIQEKHIKLFISHFTH